MANTKPKDEQYIETMYAKQLQGQKDSLKAAYDANVARSDSQKQTINQDFYDTKREMAGNAAREQLNMNERFAANGLNTGTAGQAALALRNAYNQNVGRATTQNAQQIADIETAKTNLANEYRTQVQRAITDNDTGKAAALYQLYKEQEAEAKKQVDALLSAGTMPNSDLVTKSGYSTDYVNKLYNAVLKAKAEKAAKGNGDLLDDDDPDDEDSIGTVPKTGIIVDGNRTIQVGSRAETKLKAEKAYESGEITYKEYKNILKSLH